MDSTLWAAEQAFGDSPDTKTATRNTSQRWVQAICIGVKNEVGVTEFVGFFCARHRDRAHPAQERKRGRKPLTKTDAKESPVHYGPHHPVPQVRSIRTMT